MTRRSLLGGAAAAIAASAQDAGSDEGRQFFLRLLKSSNESVGRMLDAAQPSPRPFPGRGVGRGANIAALTAAYCAPESSYYKSGNLIPVMETASAAFVAAQHPDGTLDAGNLSSPPDTAFVVEALAASLTVLRRMDDPGLARAKEALGKFLLSAGEALVTGGIHTPNHRWVVCSALARIHSLFPAPKYVNRVDDWLGEGIDIDSDGQFCERSSGIYSRVTDNALVTMARLLNRPELLVPVRKNLDMMLYYLHPDGEIETVASRRQDQNMAVSVSNYYLQYRYLAIRDNNPAYAAVVRSIEARPGEGLVEGGNPVIYFLEEPLLKRPIPEGGTIPADYARVFPNSGLARVRRGEISASVYGGSDWPEGVGSGLASNPTFFSFRKGKAALHSVRMGAQFFGEGPFRSEGLKQEGDAYTLRQRFEVPYYQPLPKGLRNPRGDYALTAAKDFRFWSKLDFPRRRMSNIQMLDQKITVTESQGAFELRFDITGHDHVPVAIEFAFRPGGELQGSLREVTARDREKVFLLTEGTAVYRVGSDAIEFGPGEAVHQVLDFSGPSYTAHGAALRAPGIRVYITGLTPLNRVITVRSL